MRRLTFIVVHHTATPGRATSLAAVDGAHRRRNWGTTAQPAYAKPSALGYFVQYHYFINWQGILTQTRLEREIGWHANRANPYSLGVALSGWFDPGYDRAPAPAQVATLRLLLRKLADQFQIPLAQIVPHRHFAPYKSCYGANLANDWARRLIS
ncbi:MAG: N-acetylmuramoyl-L-alanine amidase [Candidatus Magasanikbacteria bacterium]|nr:N-acetylmuramoyl-L-alanine amidase [Candidatus Magasanikbacteria bacterium]